jgi:hypothetical protein
MTCPRVGRPATGGNEEKEGIRSVMHFRVVPETRSVNDLGQKQPVGGPQYP